MLAASSASFSLDCPVPYIGVDFQYRHMTFKRNFGQNIFKKHSPEANGYIGLKFCDYLGIEAGYEYSWKRNSNRANGPGSIELGDVRPIMAGEINFSVNSHRIQGPHVSLVAFIPFCICDENFEIFGSVGAAHLRVRLVNQPTAFLTPDGFFAASEAQLNLLRNNFSKNKTVLKAALGVNYMMHEFAGLRIGVGYENTKKFRNIKANQNVLLRASLKDSILASVGIFWRFY